jgi:hypothetical protein
MNGPRVRAIRASAIAGTEIARPNMVNHPDMERHNAKIDRTHAPMRIPRAVFFDPGDATLIRPYRSLRPQPKPRG